MGSAGPCKIEVICGLMFMAGSAGIWVSKFVVNVGPCEGSSRPLMDGPSRIWIGGVVRRIVLMAGSSWIWVGGQGLSLGFIRASRNHLIGGWSMII